MKTITLLLRQTTCLAVALACSTPLLCSALDFSLSAETTTTANKKDLGIFNAGEVISISFTGQISLIPGWDTLADGALAQTVSDPDFLYANPGASGYPTDFGGDGINHYPDGGGNFDAGLGGVPGFGDAGATTTDTTDPNTIRLGSVIGTFSANPSRSDWFLVGRSNAIVIPSNGVHLYLAVHDTTYGNNAGNYLGKLTYLDPPVLSIRTYAGLELQGTTGENYRIDYSTAIPPVNWQVLTNLVLPYSPCLILDTTGPAVGQRIYRAVKTD